MLVQPYLNFEGRTEEAIAFYGKTVGAKVEMLMRFSECPDPMPPGMLPPGSENKVMHASFKIGDSVVMASDHSCTGKAGFQGISLTLAVDGDAEAKRKFDALADGGNVTMPLSKTFFASSFGTLTDRFGVTWMVIAEKS
jgi:PhnB protein